MKLLSEYNNSYKVKVSCIYKITNLLNGKIYIGQTIDFRKRLSDYRNVHKRKTSQSIVRAIKHDGTENFTIEILEICKPNKLAAFETYYIEKYKSYLPEYGYNKKIYDSANSNKETNSRNKSKGHIGLKESAKTKCKKSNKIIVIKGNNIMVCDSGKLFGDLIGKGKDYIKNCLRQPSKANGYRLYYDDYNKRQDIRKKMKKKRCIRDKEYMEILDILDTIEFEGVETIYRYFNNVYELVYDDDRKYRINELFLENC